VAANGHRTEFVGLKLSVIERPDIRYRRSEASIELGQLNQGRQKKQLGLLD
jgi:hypothetical protein